MMLRGFLAVAALVAALGACAADGGNGDDDASPDAGLPADDVAPRDDTAPGDVAPPGDDVPGTDPGPWIPPAACKGFNLPSGPDCAGVLEAGCCDGEGRVMWCQDGQLYCFDCKVNPQSDNQACGWRDQADFQGFDCGPTEAQDPSGTFSRLCGQGCTPRCTNRECGSNGCGGSCGTCPDGKVCQGGRCTDGGATYPAVCLGPGEPSGDTCTDGLGAPGCCDGDGRAVYCDQGRLYCIDCPSMGGLKASCGWLAQGGYYDCGGSGEDAFHPRTCGATCQPKCDGRNCGPDGCGGTCGTCDGASLCGVGGQCVATVATVTGSLSYDSRGPVIDGWGVTLSAVAPVPAKGLPIVVVGPGGATIGTGEVGADGGFAVPVSATPAGGTLVFAASWSPDGAPLFAVLKPKAGGSPGQYTSPAWAWSFPLASAAAGSLAITEAQGAGAVRLFQVVHLGLAQVLQHLGGTTAGMKTLAVLWAPGVPWSCELCYGGTVPQRVENGPYLAQSIFVGSAAGDSGAWATAAVLHEFGHYVEHNYSRDDSPGGAHTLGSLIVPAFAWAEGFANFFAVVAQTLAFGQRDGVLWAITKGGTSDFWIDFAEGKSIQGAFLPANPKGGLLQSLDECYVTAMLWDLWDGADVAEDAPPDGTALGTATMLEGAASPRFLTQDRGATGADFVDFVDALLCANPAQAPAVTQTIVDFLGFPYDGKPLCP